MISILALVLLATLAVTLGPIDPAARRNRNQS